REAGLPDPQAPPVERRPLVFDEADQDDPVDFAPTDHNNPPPNDQGADEPTEPVVENKEWESTEQFVSWIKRAKLSQSQTDEMLNLFRDQRMDMREALEIVQSHRDVDKYLMQQIVGENARMIDLSRPGLDPGPVLLTYKPLLEVVKKMAANAKAVAKKNGREGKFVLKPVIQNVKVMQKQRDGTMKEVLIAEYDHPSTGTWWHKMQREIDVDPDFQGSDYVVLPIIIYLDKTTMDGLRRVSVFPMYVSLANFSWDFYNERGGLELDALLPQPKADPDWPQPNYKPKSDGHRDLKRHFITSSLAIVTEDARKASWKGIDFVDPHGVKRKGVPQIFCISKDLGEASTISNVKVNYCDSCLVPPDEMNRLDEALRGDYPPRLEPAMRVAVNAILDLKEDPHVPRVRVTEETRKHGVHPQMPWFFKWKYGKLAWNAPYLKMVPDDLHTVYGGVLGSHFLNILEAVANIHPLGKAAFLALMNVRLHQIYLLYNPGLRLPASKEFFTERYSVPNYEWKAVMQVLPILVSGLFRTQNGVDTLVEWAVAFVEWLRAIALDNIETLRAQITEVVRQRGKYDSALVMADKAKENKLPLSYRFATLWSNMLVDVTSPQKMIFDGHVQRGAFMQLLRSQPLLSKLPAALGTYFGVHVGNVSGAALRRLNPIRYLRENNIDPRVHVVSSCYIVPHAGGRRRLQAARAIPSFHGRPVFSDVAVTGENSRTGARETWYARVVLFFKAWHKVLKWDEVELKQVWKPVEHELVFLRWFRVTAWTDDVKCDILQWEATSRREPSVVVEPIESLISVEMMLPKKAQNRNMELWFRNKYYR
ncbi:hypothetical protein KFL_010410010, partial [Klebsormidium nitens]